MSDGRPAAGPCRGCLRRAWLLAALGGHIERRHVERDPLRGLLALPDHALIDALAGPRREALLRAHEGFDADAARRRIGAAGLTAACVHGGEVRYPERLRRLPDAPAVLHLAGRGEALALLDAAADAGGHGGPDPEGAPPAVAIVGARRASPYGLETARALGRGLAAAGLPVVSGMALGADSAAHEGALAGGGTTVAVLAGGAERPYPASKGRLYRQIRRYGAAISEMPPGTAARRWGFPARNRIIAALAAVTVVVEATERSGSLITADFAHDLGATVAAVPGPVSSPLSAGTHALIRDGAALVTDAGDVLDLACGPGGRPPVEDAEAAVRRTLPPALRKLHEDLVRGQDTVAALVDGGRPLTDVLTGLAELELLGTVARAAGGRYLPVAYPRAR